MTKYKNMTDQPTNLAEYKQCRCVQETSVHPCFFLFLISFSTLTTDLPYRSFLLLRKEDASPQFNLIASRFMDLDLDFFVDKAVNERKGFLIECILTYDFDHALQSNLDLGPMPRFRRVHNEALSMDQIRILQENKRDCFKEPAKLVSSHEENVQVIDFVDVLLYQVLFQSCLIVEVLSVTAFETAPYLRDYIGEYRTDSIYHTEINNF